MFKYNFLCPHIQIFVFLLKQDKHIQRWEPLPETSNP